jgi:hypothetical protein
MPDLEQFALDLHQEVLMKSGDEADSRLREDAFTEHVIDLFSAHGVADGAEVCQHVGERRGQSPAAKMNGWGLSGDQSSLDLFVALYHGTGKVANVGLPEARNQLKLLRGFLDRALGGLHGQVDESTNVFRAARDIYAARDTLMKVRLFLITDGIVPRIADLNREDKPGLDIQYEVWDLEKLSKLQVGYKECIQLDFVHDYNGALDCLRMSDATGEYRTYLAFLNGPLLARIYGEHGQRLLERNCRAFLQPGNRVNKGIQQTIREQPHRFLAYNNGLCCTAAEVKVRHDGDGHTRIESVKDFQIVNGGQTTASLYHALKKEKQRIDQVVVLMKLTELREPDKSNEFVPLISRYANTQSKVNAADLEANSLYHRNLERLSRTVWAPPASGLESGTHWYYERARGSYADDKARCRDKTERRDWERNNPLAQKFTKTDLAKYEHVWAGAPYLVCMGAEKNFIEFAKWLEEGEVPEVNQDYFQQVVARAILWRSAERRFDALRRNGYRANSVAYALAWLVERAERRIDLDAIWKRQRLSDALGQAVQDACLAAWEFLTKHDGNIGEISKREPTWTRFRAMPLKVDEAWLQELRADPIQAAEVMASVLARNWEKRRQPFIEYHSPLETLEAATNRTWVRARKGDPVSQYAD